MSGLSFLINHFNLYQTMSRIIPLLSILIWLSNSNVMGQSSKKERIQSYREMTRLDTSALKMGKHLEYAATYSAKQYIEYHAEYGTTNMSKKWGETIIEQLYQDSTYTYFARKTTYFLISFFRVNNDELKGLNYKEFDGNFLREKFLAEVVPETDKQKVARGQELSTEFQRADFKYNYQPETKLLEVTYRWKIRRDFVESVINKTYRAVYDLNSKQFVQVAPPHNKKG